ncbi:MAG: hypothetical protein OXE05_07350 [Chloroflexi bacterium]|nr:hypothetical protein [Chloroflexota bacterium]
MIDESAHRSQLDALQRSAVSPHHRTLHTHPFVAGCTQFGVAEHLLDQSGEA